MFCGASSGGTCRCGGSAGGSTGALISNALRFRATAFEQDKRFLGPSRQPESRPSDRVFGMETAAFRRMLYRLQLPPELAALKIHPHMLRHTCGFDLAGGADLRARAAFMGHKRLENTVRYSKLAPEHFEGLRP